MYNEILKCIRSACENILYIKSDFNHPPYLTKLIELKGPKVADSITPLIELFHLIGKETHHHFEIVDSFDFKMHEYKSGIYISKDNNSKNIKYKGIAVVEIPTGKFRSIVIDSGGGISSSKHTFEMFRDIKGQYIIPFDYDGIYVHPNCYTYFFIENDFNRLMPMEAFEGGILSDEEKSVMNWVEEAIEFANTYLGFSIVIPETENFIEKVI